MKIQIESEGTGVTTNVYAIGDDGSRTRIRGVQSVKWSVDARGVASATIDLLPVGVNAFAEWDGKPQFCLTLPSDLDEAQVDDFVDLFRKTVRQAEADGFRPTITVPPPEGTYGKQEVLNVLAAAGDVFGRVLARHVPEERLPAAMDEVATGIRALTARAVDAT